MPAAGSLARVAWAGGRRLFLYNTYTRSRAPQGAHSLVYVFYIYIVHILRITFGPWVTIAATLRQPHHTPLFFLNIWVSELPWMVTHSRHLYIILYISVRARARSAWGLGRRRIRVPRCDKGPPIIAHWIHIKLRKEKKMAHKVVSEWKYVKITTFPDKFGCENVCCRVRYTKVFWIKKGMKTTTTRLI